MDRKLILEINVKTLEAEVLGGDNTRVVTIPFSAESDGEYFKGRTITNGVDTQILTKDGGFTLSARYMLTGTDSSGNKCKLFIENNGTSLDNCTPKIYTDSEELKFMENSELSASVECVENGVIVRIYINSANNR